MYSTYVVVWLPQGGALGGLYTPTRPAIMISFQHTLLYITYHTYAKKMPPPRQGHPRSKKRRAASYIHTTYTSNIY